MIIEKHIFMIIEKHIYDNINNNKKSKEKIIKQNRTITFFAVFNFISF